MKIVINALSASSGGGITVATAYAQHLSKSFNVTLLLSKRNPAHEEIKSRLANTSVQLHMLPASFVNIFYRTMFEGRILNELCDSSEDILIQLNGLLPFMLHWKGRTCLLIQDPSPYIKDTHGTSRGRFSSFLRRTRQKTSINNVDFIFWTSEYIRGLVTKHHNLPKYTGTVVYNGLETNVGTGCSTYLHPRSPRLGRLITIGNIAPYKGHEQVIRALPSLIISFPSCRYDIVGACKDESFKQLLLTVAKDCGVEDHVFFHGRLPEKEKDLFISKSDVFILLSKCESFGIPVIEAQAFGVPVVVSHHTALPEIVGEGGGVVNPDKPIQVSQAILSFLEDDVFAKDCIKKGYVNCQKYQWESIIDKITNIFEGSMA